MSEQTHWIENDSVRAKFWSVAQSEYGLDHDGVHEVLRIKSLKDFTGTFEDAIAALKKWEQGQLTGALAAECKQLPEAPVVAFTDLISPNGFRWCVTVRAGLPPDLARQAVAQTIDLLKTVEKSALASGWSAPGNGRKPAPTQAQAAPPTLAGGSPPPVAQGGNGNLTFQAETLSGNVSEGNVYWKVKGGKYKQWGVTIWPEILAEAGFESDGLDPMKTYDLTGHVAHYVTNDGGNPQKVTSLVRQ